MAVFSCYPLLKHWLPAIGTPRSQAGNLADFWVRPRFNSILLMDPSLV